MLSERIDSEMKVAAKAQDKKRLGTLRMLKSAMKYREIETGKALEDADVIGVVGTLIKQRRDSAAQFMGRHGVEIVEPLKVISRGRDWMKAWNQIWNW